MLSPYVDPWTFKRWLAEFRSVDLPIGDLARDASEDPNFPEDDDFCDIVSYVLRKCGSGREVLSVLAEAWSYYLASTRGA